VPQATGAAAQQQQSALVLEADRTSTVREDPEGTEVPAAADNGVGLATNEGLVESVSTAAGTQHAMDTTHPMPGERPSLSDEYEMP